MGEGINDGRRDPALLTQCHGCKTCPRGQCVAEHTVCSETDVLLCPQECRAWASVVSWASEVSASCSIACTQPVHVEPAPDPSDCLAGQHRSGSRRRCGAESDLADVCECGRKAALQWQPGKPICVWGVAAALPSLAHRAKNGRSPVLPLDKGGQELL